MALILTAHIVKQAYMMPMLTLWPNINLGHDNGLDLIYLDPEQMNHYGRGISKYDQRPKTLN